MIERWPGLAESADWDRLPRVSEWDTAHRGDAVAPSLTARARVEMIAAVADIKKKKAEHTAAEIAILSIDSPGVMTLTDLDTLGLTSVTFQQGLATGGGGGGFEPPPPAPTDEYFAIRDDNFHPADLPGALPNGVWLGPSRERADEAAVDRDSHEDGHARVMYRMGSTLVGPINTF